MANLSLSFCLRDVTFLKCITCCALDFSFWKSLNTLVFQEVLVDQTLIMEKITFIEKAIHSRFICFSIWIFLALEHSYSKQRRTDLWVGFLYTFFLVLKCFSSPAVFVFLTSFHSLSKHFWPFLPLSFLNKKPRKTGWNWRSSWAFPFSFLSLRSLTSPSATWMNIVHSSIQLRFTDIMLKNNLWLKSVFFHNKLLHESWMIKGQYLSSMHESNYQIFNGKIRFKKCMKM